jgi:hypothetical protein
LKLELRLQRVKLGLVGTGSILNSTSPALSGVVGDDRDLGHLAGDIRHDRHGIAHHQHRPWARPSSSE